MTNDSNDILTITSLEVDANFLSITN